MQSYNKVSSRLIANACDADLRTLSPMTEAMAEGITVEGAMGMNRDWIQEVDFWY